MDPVGELDSGGATGFEHNNIYHRLSLSRPGFDVEKPIVADEDQQRAAGEDNGGDFCATWGNLAGSNEIGGELGRGFTALRGHA